MKPVLPLFIFIDACGWEIVKDDPFLRSVARLPGTSYLGVWLQFGMRALDSFRSFGPASIGIGVTLFMTLPTPPSASSAT